MDSSSGRESQGDLANTCQLDLEIVEPDDTQKMGEVIGRAKVCLSSVVYPIDGDAVIQACIEQRTDYVDWSVLPFSPFTSPVQSGIG